MAVGLERLVLCLGQRSTLGLLPLHAGIAAGGSFCSGLIRNRCCALSRTLNALVGQGQFQPFKVPLGCPAITHLSFADDVVIFTNGLKSSL